jgi:hypothetical protein
LQAQEETALEAIPELRRPFGASKASAAGIVACPRKKTPGHPKYKSVHVPSAKLPRAPARIAIPRANCHRCLCKGDATICHASITRCHACPHPLRFADDSACALEVEGCKPLGHRLEHMTSDIYGPVSPLPFPISQQEHGGCGHFYFVRKRGARLRKHGTNPQLTQAVMIPKVEVSRG